MLILVAGRHDPATSRLADRWASYGATLLTVSDLSTAGWRQFQGCTGEAQAVAGGRLVPAEEITGVLIRWPGVYEAELTQIVPEDRAYVAAEMTAFLTFWASRLPCPVLNRPSATCLLGPGWRPEQWTLAAAKAGLAVLPVRRRVEFPVVSPRAAAPPATWAECGSCAVTVVGERCFGPVEPSLARQARRLATAAGVDLLQVHFSAAEAGAFFLGADLLPDVSNDDMADAVLSYLLGGGDRR